jgi:hypothetical protein
LYLLCICLAQSPWPKKTPKWIHSKEKDQLKKDILDGVVTDDMRPAVVYQMHDGIYQKYKYTNFTTNLRNLRIAITKSIAAAYEDEIAFQNIRKQWTAQVNPAYPPWHNSAAKALLLEDIKAGATDGLKAAAVWELRPEYLQFPLNVFRDHLSKEKTKPKVKANWEHQKKLKKLKKEGKTE